jgi:ABC-2 type transport system ATP-binding protein
MDEVADVCDRVIFLGAGRIVAVGRPEDLAAEAAATRVTLRVERGLAQLVHHLSARGVPCIADDQDIEIEIDEPHVADLLATIAAAGVTYSRIALRKPTLEDYFLKLAGRGEEAS